MHATIGLMNPEHTNSIFNKLLRIQPARREAPRVVYGGKKNLPHRIVQNSKPASLLSRLLAQHPRPTAAAPTPGEAPPRPPPPSWQRHWRLSPPPPGATLPRPRCHPRARPIPAPSPSRRPTPTSLGRHGAVRSAAQAAAAGGQWCPTDMARAALLRVGASGAGQPGLLRVVAAAPSLLFLARRLGGEHWWGPVAPLPRTAARWRALGVARSMPGRADPADGCFPSQCTTSLPVQD
ncbi:hypothetical protein BS78_01G233300 [Paspalum vaginatum]|nr:hypothetical protein BS78_01G233300 [Paspalum vaginatum]